VPFSRSQRRPELQYADHLVPLILHGHNKHRFRAVAELLIEIAIQPERHVSDAIRVLDIKDLPCRRSVACDALRVDGQSELPEGHRMAVALGQLEHEVLAAVGFVRVARMLILFAERLHEADRRQRAARDVGEEVGLVLQVRGDSMQDEAILDGDYVLVEKTKTAHNGDIVVALVENSDATLKRLYREGETIRLQPSNATMKPIIVPAAAVEVQGRVIGVLRKY